MPVVLLVVGFTGRCLALSSVLVIIAVDGVVDYVLRIFYFVVFSGAFGIWLLWFCGIGCTVILGFRCVCFVTIRLLVACDLVFGLIVCWALLFGFSVLYGFCRHFFGVAFYGRL